ncbi:class I SAM-dependent methyltransferase [Paenibacillus qinlingensis]|uniref:2-polyprenyl-3-methyl-5-hydroxy-6-metoxy-1, 4-benzoquinol methylase n=1 Tax=Paenibacillus qinlingensis TaxID=1837343 RepID=A0ABU1NSX5_9BACL|nr:class I SAM-dependent methyltransferase [Paenibacillus qinlingensis]MDR6550112.1 2-polyprenyl-3-methyl-5-hydroxy-6-metoxy-1,4-benzoquinol methylase [Paenibacillus qinlingensis]
MENYWNHNTAFHNELVADAKLRGGRVLDIGCGDGLLLQRLAPIAQGVVGIDPDLKAISLAQKRLAATANVSFVNDDFLAMPVPPPEERFATIICVATLHHMELRKALQHMGEFLAPGGRLLVIGLAEDKTFMDLLISGLYLVPIRIMDRMHGGMKDPAVRIAAPKESIGEIRQAAVEVLPGASIRRRFYYRYCLRWSKR